VFPNFGISVIPDVRDEKKTQVQPMVKTQNTEVSSLNCRAEFIFDTRTRGNGSRPIKVLSECMCDCRRPDWESRWKDWNSRLDPYLNLFLCAKHARNLGLMK
jgi:hypothetical protein